MKMQKTVINASFLMIYTNFATFNTKDPIPQRFNNSNKEIQCSFFSHFLENICPESLLRV